MEEETEGREGWMELKKEGERGNEREGNIGMKERTEVEKEI